MESRIHGDMYVRFGGRLVETYHRKVAKCCWPSLLKEIADLCGIHKNLTFHVTRHTFASEVCLLNGVPIETISRLLGHTSVKTTQIYAKISDTTIDRDMAALSKKLNQIEKFMTNF